MSMSMKFLTGATLSMAVGLAIGSSPAWAQEVDTTPITVLQGFENAFFAGSDSFYNSRTITGQFNRMFGIGGFAEQRIERGAASVEEAYRNHMALQNTLDPTIRVPDLNNPYSTTLLLMPSEQAGSRILGTEFIYETLPTP